MVNNRGNEFLMKMTFGMNIAKENIKFKNLTKHIYRKNRFQDKNKNINWKLTKYNKSVHLLDEKKLIKKHCGNYIKKYNHRQILQGHKKRCYKSTWDYFKRHGKHATRCVTISLGNMQQRKKYESKQLAPTLKKLKYKSRKRTKWQEKYGKFDVSNKWIREMGKRNYEQNRIRAISAVRRGSETKALIKTLKKFNKTHKRLKCIAGVIHSDENIIHCHAEMIALPSPTNTKHHRPSFGFSKAVKEEGNNKDGRKALHNIQSQTAPQALKYLSEYGGIHIDLERTGNASRLSGAKYKEYAKQRDSASAEQKKVSSATSKARSVSTMAVKVSQAASTIAHHAYFTGSTEGSKANKSSAKSYASSLNTSSADSLYSLQNRLNSSQSRIIKESSKASSSADSASSSVSSAIASAGSSWNSLSGCLSGQADSLDSHFNSVSQSLKNEKIIWYRIVDEAIILASPQISNRMLSSVSSDTNGGLAHTYFTCADGKKRSGMDLATYKFSSDLAKGVGVAEANKAKNDISNYQASARSRNIKSNMNSGEEFD